MLIYVFKLQKKILFLLIPIVIIIVFIIITIMDKNSVGVFAPIKELPIYSVESIEKKVAITFDCAWGADDIPQISAIRPIRITARPPIPPANPIVRPAASALLLGMASWAATTVTAKLDSNVAPARPRKTVLNVPCV